MGTTTEDIEVRQFAAPPHAEWRPRHNPWAIALTVTMATFMEVLDTSIANVALPHIAGSLSASTDESTWVLTSYLVSNAVVLPISGWASDIMGRKRFYMTCVALFGLSSLLCGLAPSLSLLIFFRVLQGVGGGGLAPSEQAILADTFEPKKRGVAFAVYGMAVVLAPAIGPTLGGWITDNYDWRWIFFINVPVAVLSLFLTNRLVEDPPELAHKRNAGIKIDYIGLALVGVDLGCLQMVLDRADSCLECHCARLGLSRRRSRVRVPSLPLSKSPLSGTFSFGVFFTAFFRWGVDGAVSASSASRTPRFASGKRCP